MRDSRSWIQRILRPDKTPLPNVSADIREYLAEAPRNQPFRLFDWFGSWPEPDSEGYRVRHYGPNRHERRRLATAARRFEREGR